MIGLKSPLPDDSSSRVITRFVFITCHICFGASREDGGRVETVGDHAQVSM